MNIDEGRTFLGFKVYSMITRRLTGALLFLHAVSSNALACSPPPPEIFASTEKRVRERYTAADFVELVTIVDVQRITKPGRHGDVLLLGEKVTFRVDKIFKGKSKPGDKIIVESTGMCAYRVDGNAALKTVFSPDGGGVVIPPRQWLFYRNGDTVQIGETDKARPINQVGLDLQLLERWQKK